MRRTAKGAKRSLAGSRDVTDHFLCVRIGAATVLCLDWHRGPTGERDTSSGADQ